VDFVDAVFQGLCRAELELFTQDTPAPGSEGGGLRNAIAGSGLILLFPC